MLYKGIQHARRFRVAQLSRPNHLPEGLNKDDYDDGDDEDDDDDDVDDVHDVHDGDDVHDVDGHDD